MFPLKMRRGDWRLSRLQAGMFRSRRFGFLLRNQKAGKCGCFRVCHVYLRRLTLYVPRSK